MYQNPSAGGRSHAAPHVPVLLASVSEPTVSEGGNPYFLAHFKRGLLGKPVARTLFGKANGEGHTEWERASPDDLRPLVGCDLSGEVAVETAEIEPEEFTVPSTGEVRVQTTRTVVRFLDESLDQAVRRAGSLPKGALEAASIGALGHALVGDGYLGDEAVMEAFPALRSAGR